MQESIIIFGAVIFGLAIGFVICLYLCIDKIESLESAIKKQV